MRDAGLIETSAFCRCKSRRTGIDRLQQATIEKDGKAITTRTHVTGQVGNVFKAAGIALPNNIVEQPAS